MRANRIRSFRKKLAQGEAVLVANADHPSPSLVERLGSTLVDAVFIDCEQTAVGIESVENMARAARLTDLLSLVRLYSPADWAIERALKCGVDGVVVPRLESPDQAAEVVAAVRYCSVPDQEPRLVVVQIETRGAIETLDAFLAIDGIDVYFIGPVDLAKSLGHSSDYRDPRNDALITETIIDIRQSGKVAGILVDKDSMERAIRRGVQFLYLHVNDFIDQGIACFGEEIKRSLSKRAFRSAH